MLSKMVRALALGAGLAVLAGCVANGPTLVPIALTDPPLNPPGTPTISARGRKLHVSRSPQAI